MKFSEIKLPSNRKFGITFSIIFLIIGLYLGFTAAYFLLVYTSIILASLFLSLAIYKPKWLSKLNRAWMFFGFLLSLIISPIVMGVIFFLVFTPVSLIMKLFGRDELILKKGNRSSYWISKPINNHRKNPFKQQF